jgi:glycerophosphoryl diester phosphodiesterase
LSTIPLPSQQGRPLVIAHRGASAYKPENTMAAYQLAIDQQADMIEIDLHTTQDGAIAVSHDGGLEHLGAKGEIADVCWAELQQLDAGEGERVPCLDEVLDRFGESIPFNLEIKTAERGRYPGLEDAAVSAVEDRAILERTLFSSFDDRVLAAVRRRSADARIGLLLSPGDSQRAIARAQQLGAEAINPHVLLVDADLVEAAHGEGMAVYVYTVDALDTMLRLIDLGVDGLFTNRPDRMRELLSSRGI